MVPWKRMAKWKPAIDSQVLRRNWMPIPKCFISILLKAEEDEGKKSIDQKNQIFKMGFSGAFAKKKKKEKVWEGDIPVGRTW